MVGTIEWLIPKQVPDLHQRITDQCWHNKSSVSEFLFYCHYKDNNGQSNQYMNYEDFRVKILYFDKIFF
jgi:hypothetical protein